MIDVHRIETEAEHQRFEWQRAVEADALTSQAVATPRRPRWPRLPRLSLAGLRSLAAPRRAVAALAQPCEAAVVTRPANC